MTAVHAEPPRTLPALNPAVRAQLPAGVLARPLDDAVPLHVWVRVAETLEASAHAMACAADGTSAAVLEVLVGFAEGTAARTEADLAWHRTTSAPDRLAGNAVQATERSWLRLAAVLLGAPPADPELLRSCVRQHHDALAAWRATL